MSYQFMTQLKRVSVVATVLVATVMAGCVTVQSDVDSRFNIRNYHSYQLEYTGGTNASAFNNPINARRLRDAVEANLTKRGLHAAAEGETPDCIVSVSTGSRQVMENEPVSPRIGFGLGWGGRGYRSSVMWDNDVYAYNEHRIAIDMLDNKSRDPVWHASVAENINSGSGATAEARIRKAVDTLFTKFP